MHQNKVIKQLESLRAVKPDSDWAETLKTKILSQKEGVSIWEQFQQTLFAPLQKPILAVAPLVLIAAVLGGLVVYFAVLPRISEMPVITTLLSEQGLSKQTLASLSELEKDLAEVKQKLDQLEQAKNTSQALLTAEAAKTTAQQGKEVMAKAARANSKEVNQVLASISGLYEEVEKKATGIQKEKVGQLLEELKERSLDSKAQARLEVAEKYYEAGQYVDALLLIQQI